MAGTPGDPSALITAELRIHQAPPHDVEDPTSLYVVVVHRVINVDSMGYEFHISDFERLFIIEVFLLKRLSYLHV